MLIAPILLFLLLSIKSNVGKSRNELFGELLAGQCDVVLVDRDGLPHRLVQLVPLIVSANEIVRCREEVALDP